MIKKWEEKRMKKVLSILLAAGLLTATLAGTAGAEDSAFDPQPLPYYLSVTGTVVSAEDEANQDGWLKVSITTTDENPAYLVLTENTVYPFEKDFAEGDVVTGYFLANAPMIAIWPPQYTVAILVAGMPGDLNFKADRFNTWEDNDAGYMLAQSGQFAFLIDENTEIVLANGDDFSDGDIEGRRMAVIYGPSTRSIPEMATAIKVIVLYEDAVTLPEQVPEEVPDLTIDASGWPILVNGTKIDAPDAYQNADGILMVPLRATAEALGFDVNWDNAAKSVRLGVAIHLWIDKTEVHVGRMAPISISTAPQLINGTTYVPLDFFRNALGMANAFAFEGQIEINSEGESME